MLRPTFLSFETAKRAISISQLGLDTVGHNVANAKTPGYTRQRLDQVSISSGGYKAQFQPYGVQFPGQGALATGINQVRDPFLDKRYRDEASNYGELAIKSNGLEDLESLFNELTKDGIGSKINEMIKELNKLGVNAESKELAVVMRSYSQQLAQILNHSAKELDTIMNQQMFDLDVAVAQDVNNTLERIAVLNEKIREDNFYNNPSNELNDERNMLIDQLSEFLDIKVVRTPVKITEDLTIENVSIELKNSGEPPIKLVDGNEFKSLSIVTHSDGKTGIQLRERAGGVVIREDISGLLHKGAIRGYLDMINGDGAYAVNGGNSFRGVPYYQKALDTFAQTFANFMNQTNIPEISVNPPGNLYDLFTSGDPSQPITAKNIQISKQWQDDESFLTTSKNTNPPNGPGSNKNDNISRFITGLTSSRAFTFEVEGTKRTLFTGSFQEAMTNIQSTVGLDVSLNDNLLSASFSVISNLSDRRDAISAVSIDEEAISMMTYQKYLNAASRYMTTLDEALGTIIQSMGIVGR